MTTTLSTANLRKTARLTGVLYFIFALLGTYTFFYVQPRVFTNGDAVATAQNMLAHESLLRVGTACGIITNFMFVVIVLLFYKIFCQVNAFLAKLMVGFVLVALPVALLGDVLELTALSIFKGNVLKTVQLDEHAQFPAMAFLKIRSISGQLLTFFWGIWLFPLGWLAYRSGFIPRIFGVLLLINGVGYLVQCFTFILFPESLQAVIKMIFPIYFTGEIPFIFWLLIKGVRGV